ncbi:MAG: hypothetical protein J3K34DRAFT_467596 [Monoraphidium minutum]|nr:MAG: hypothetical protein J3K34DRAFT_467596 [Monoraphidium minutum]
MAAAAVRHGPRLARAAAVVALLLVAHSASAAAAQPDWPRVARGVIPPHTPLTEQGDRPAAQRPGAAAQRPGAAAQRPGAAAQRLTAAQVAARPRVSAEEALVGIKRAYEAEKKREALFPRTAEELRLEAEELGKFSAAAAATVAAATASNAATVAAATASTAATIAAATASNAATGNATACGGNATAGNGTACGGNSTDGGNGNTTAAIEIEVYFHVLTYLGQGVLAQSEIDAQIAVLNAAFAPHFKFRLVSAKTVTGVSQQEFFGIAADGYFYSDAFFEFMAFLHQGNHSTLNVITSQMFDADGGLFGLAQFPTTCFSEGCAENNVFIDYRTLPNGAVDSRQQGDTLVGHWLGLLHTFEGESCEFGVGGDLVSDTAQEEAPRFECIENDSCRDDEGPDPIHNFMDYTPDACITHFTPGQFARMLAMWHAFRAPPLRTCAKATLPNDIQCEFVPSYRQCDLYPLHCDACGTDCGWCPSHMWPAGGTCDGRGAGSRCVGTCAAGHIPGPWFGRALPEAYCSFFGYWEYWFGGHAAARAACAAAGGELATLPNADHAGVVGYYLAFTPGWIGLESRGRTPSTNPADWAWLSTGLPPSAYGFENWLPANFWVGEAQQPDNLGGQQGQAAVMRGDLYDFYHWDDRPVGEAAPYVCQPLGASCDAASLPAAADNSAWPAGGCSGRPNDGAKCEATCAPPLGPGLEGPPSTTCRSDGWAPITGSCVAGATALGCSVVIEPLDPSFANGEAAPISLAEVQLFSKPGGRIKRADLAPFLSASVDGFEVMNPFLSVGFPCDKTLNRVVIQNVKSKDMLALNRITSYRLHIVSDGGALDLSFEFRDVGAKPKYTVQVGKDGTWRWKV